MWLIAFSYINRKKRGPKFFPWKFPFLEFKFNKLFTQNWRTQWLSIPPRIIVFESSPRHPKEWTQKILNSNSVDLNKEENNDYLYLHEYCIQVYARAPNGMDPQTGSNCKDHKWILRIETCSTSKNDMLRVACSIYKRYKSGYQNKMCSFKVNNTSLLEEQTESR